ncbi:ABC transporter permease [Quadrisphaera sp. DSM 44207]|uniref:ABC transporter permease n=1 Tax=Quadrisphaera sp. DSM 44207 TaxID=1881057 RepID=UPI000884F061|nr:ABC transporter permease [Quadrisphaera sp. DSM 44207]SDQ19349.1 monosaccharide ABC transporter membrane protein, CUT2 family [Quadrisphaera sp. DSM 44207]
MSAVDSSRTATGTAEPPPPAAPSSASLPPWRRALGSSAAYMAGVLLVLVLVFSFAQPDSFPTLNTGRNILMDMAVLLVMAVGMTFVLVAAGFDISIGSVLVFSGVCAAKVMEATGGQGAGTVVLGLLVALAAGTAWGAVNGWVIARLRVPALITTLGSMGAALGAALLISDGTDVRTVPRALIAVSADRPLGVSWLVWVAAVVAVVGGVVLSQTRFGRHTQLIGSNAESARRSGIDVDRHTFVLYTVNGALAGLAGMLSLTRFATTTVSGHTTDGLEVITGVVLGGTSLFGGIGTVLGTTIGMAIPAVLNNGFVQMNVQPFWQEVAIGVVLVVAVYLDQLKRRRRERV